MKSFLLSAAFVLSFNLFAFESRYGQCVSEDQSWFVITDESIEIYDSLYDESYEQALVVLRESPLQLKASMAGFEYYLYQDVQKSRLFHVYETASATTRRFYCPLRNHLKEFLRASAGLWHAADGSVLEIKEDGMAFINDYQNGQTVMAVMNLEQKTNEKIKVRFDEYFLSYRYSKGGEIWVYNNGTNRPFYKVN